MVKNTPQLEGHNPSYRFVECNHTGTKLCVEQVCLGVFTPASAKSVDHKFSGG